MKRRLMLVAGARPNYMKVAPIHRAACAAHATRAADGLPAEWSASRRALDAGNGDDGFDVDLVHTGQHYDASLSDDFFRDLGLPRPLVNLAVGSASHAQQTAKVMASFESVVAERKPDAVVVVGDVNSTLACALVAAKIVYEDDGRNWPALLGGRRGPLVVHVEAGLRSRDRAMPEETNRIATDAISDLLLTTCRDADTNLLAEGVAPERIRLVGNPMIDSLLASLEAAGRVGFLERAGLIGRRFALATLHRPSNVDEPRALGAILDALSEAARELPVLLPLHPRTRARVHEFGLGARLAAGPLEGDERPAAIPADGVVALDPLSYLEMLQAMQRASFVLTDSGGIQEETTALGIPCVTVRENTERPVTITEGTNVLAGTRRESILGGIAQAKAKAATTARVPELWDGHAGERILDAIVAAFADAGEGRRPTEERRPPRRAGARRGTVVRGGDSDLALPLPRVAAGEGRS